MRGGGVKEPEALYCTEPAQQPQAQDRRTVTRRMGSAAAKESFYEMVTTTCKRLDDY